MATHEIRESLHVIDSELVRHAEVGETLDLHLLGRSALIVGYEVTLMTKDVDVVDDHDSRLLKVAERIFGKDSANRPTDLYLETVSSGLPPLPIGYQNRCVEIPGPWQIIRPKRPEAHDLVVSKLRRFHAGDREDIMIICDHSDINAITLQERFNSAHTFDDLDDPRIVKANNHLQRVYGYLSGALRTI